MTEHAVARDLIGDRFGKEFDHAVVGCGIFLHSAQHDALRQLRHGFRQKIFRCRLILHPYFRHIRFRSDALGGEDLRGHSGNFLCFRIVGQFDLGNAFSVGWRLRFPTAGMDFQKRHHAVGMPRKDERGFRTKLLQGFAQRIGPVFVPGDGFHDGFCVQMRSDNDHIRFGGANFRHDLFQRIHRRDEADPAVKTEPDPVIVPVAKQTDHGDLQSFAFQHGPGTQTLGRCFGGIRELNIGAQHLTGSKEIAVAAESLIADPELMIARHKNIVLERIETFDHGSSGIRICGGRTVGNIAAIHGNQVFIRRPFLINDRADLSDGCLSVNIRGVKDRQFLCGECSCTQTQQQGVKFFHHSLRFFLLSVTLLQCHYTPEMAFFLPGSAS